MHVSAKDQATGNQQGMTITGGSSLSKDEIDRMMADAEAHAAEDKARRESAETRNTAEQLVYQTEKLIADYGDKIPAESKTELENSLAELKTVLADADACGDAIKDQDGALNEVSSKVGSAMYAGFAAEPAARPAADGARRAPAPSDDDVVDAEVIDEEK